MQKILVLFCLLFTFQIAVTGQKKADTLLIDPDNIPLNSGLENSLSGRNEINGTESEEEIPGNYANETGWLLYQFAVPSNGKVISKFGPRRGRLHAGIDLKMPKGDTIFAAFDGIVSRAQYYHGYGNLIVINHGIRLETYYGHLSGYISHLGDTIKKGQAIGLAGATGRATCSHLHFEIRENKKPYNPELVYNFESGKIKDDVWSITSLASLMREKSQKQEELADNSKPVEKPERHIVRYGDSLWKIARRYGTSIASLCRLNNLTEATILNMGMVIKLK